MNRFDRILWRINGVVFLVMLLGAGISAGIVICESFLWSTDRHKDADLINVNQSTHEKEYFHLGNPDLYAVTPSIRMPLYVDRNIRGSFSSGSDIRVRNYLFLDLSSMESHWLFQGYGHLIPECYDLRSPFKIDGKKVVASVYTVIDSDSNHDGRIDTDDQPVAYFAAADGNQITQIVPPCERIVSVDQVSDGEFLVVYTVQKSTVGAVFSVQNGKKLREAKISLDEKQLASRIQ